MANVNAANIPQDLKDRPQWVLWRYETRDGKPTKVPYTPQAGRRASVTDPATWATFGQALAVYQQGGWAGVGYVLTEADPFTGVDLDKCLTADGQPEPWAAYHVARLDSYTEVTPSGQGLRIFIKGKLPPGPRRRGQIEVYDSGRFLTLTGQHLPGTPTAIQDRAGVIDAWHTDTFGPPTASEPSPQLVTQPVDLDDARLIDKARSARSGPDFDALWRGDTSLYQGDDSRADYHLCRHLLFWTGGDPARADRLFRQSGLYRAKWDEARRDSTYGGVTMAAALQHVGAFYTPQPSPNGRNGHTPPAAANSQPVGDELSTDSHESRESRPPRYQLLHAAALADLPPVTWLIKDEVAAGQFNLFYGPSGGGKSFVALDWALQIAQTAPVVYVAAEDAQGYAARVLAWCKHHRKSAGHLYFVPEPVNLSDPAAVGDFITQARPLQPVFIVFDTLARCMTGADENSARDMGVVVDHIELIRHQTGAAVAPVHHSGKNGQSYRGSSALFGAAYTVIELKNDDGVITVVSEKAKNTPKFAPRRLSLIQVSTGRETPDGDAETSCVLIPSEQVYTPRDALTDQQRQILEFLALDTFAECGAKSAVIQRATGMPEASLYRRLSALKRKDFIDQGQRGDPFTITDAGRQAVAPARDSHSHPLSNDSHETPESLPPGSLDSQLSSLSHPFRGESERELRERQGWEGKTEEGSPQGVTIEEAEGAFPFRPTEAHVKAFMVLAAAPSPLPLADWLRASQLPPPSFKRLVDKLVAQRWVAFDGQTYQTAPKDGRLSADVRPTATAAA